MIRKPKTIQPVWLILVVTFLYSCNPRVSTTLSDPHPPLNPDSEVLVFGIQDPVPTGGKIIGNIKVGDTGFSSNCNYEKVLQEAIIAARHSGANVLKITHHKRPDALSTCHRINATMLRFDPESIPTLTEQTDSVMKFNEYALLRIYRYPSVAKTKPIPLSTEGKVFTYVPENYKSTLVVKKLGLTQIEIPGSEQEVVSINFEAGKEYYLQCFIIPASSGAIPSISLQSPENGKASYNALNAERTGPGLRYAPVHKPLRISLSGGYAYMLGKIEEGLRDDYEAYLREIRHGYSFSGDFSYFFTPTYGLGFRFAEYRTSNSMDNFTLSIPGTTNISGTMTESISIRFIGPVFSMRSYMPPLKHAFFYNIGIGYVSYLDEILFQQNFTIEGSTLGMVLDLGYDYLLSDHIALGFQFSLYGGNLRKYEMSDGVTTETIRLETDELISTGHIDVSAGIRFFF